MIIKLIIAVVSLLSSTYAFSTDPVSYFSVEIFDEAGKPVEGAIVKGGFSNLEYDYIPGSGDKAITDANGKAEIYGPAYFYVDVSVDKDGYYKSKKRIPVNQKKDQEFSVLLRQKHDPVALYAKKINLIIPMRDQEYGFDFFKGDFVLPGHDGSQVDFKIKFSRDLVDDNNFTQTVSLSFNNPTDGVVDMKIDNAWTISELKTPYLAPLEKYKRSIKLEYTRGGGGVKKKNVNVPFFIRIRSSENKDGFINMAYYCKISSGIRLYGVLANQPSLKMSYYCSPIPNDRNLEFDPQKNLFKSLKHEEKIWMP